MAEPHDINWRRYLYAREHGHMDYVDMARKCNRYVEGDQWSEEDRQRLKAENRPALTLNMIFSTVNIMTGEQQQKRADVRFRPADAYANADVAQALNRLWLYDAQRTRLDYTRAQVFADGVIQDRGYYDVRIEFDDSMTGHLAITSLDPTTVLPDPDATDYDPKTWSEVIVTKWMSLDEVEGKYGADKAAKLKSLALGGTYYGVDSVLFEDAARFRTTTFVDPSTAQYYGPDTQKQIKAIRVIDRQYYKLTQADHFVDPETGDTKLVPQTWDAERAAEFAQVAGLQVISRKVRKVRWTVSADNVVLFDDWSPYATFTVVPYFPMYRRGRPIGIVRHLLDAQDQYNKLSSQELHIVNTTANSGWVVDEDALVNMTPEELAQSGAKTGLVIVKKFGREAYKIEPNRVPSGVDRLSTKSLMNLKEISNTTDIVRGDLMSGTSGRATNDALAQASKFILPALRNLSYTDELLAEKVLNLWQQFYSEPRIIQVTREDVPQELREPIAINEVDVRGAILNDITLGRYNITVTSSPSTETYFDDQFSQAIDMRANGVFVPDDRVIEYSNLADKMRIAAEVRDMQGRGEVSEQEQKMAAMAQDLQMQMAVAELMLKQAEIEKIQAEVAKLRAEAAYTDGGEDSPKFKEKIAELDQRMQEAREGYKTRLELAQMQNKGTMHKALMDFEGRTTTANINTYGALSKALIDAKTKRKQDDG